MRFLTILAVIVICFETALGATQNIASFETTCERALRDLGLTLSDMRIRSDCAKKDIFRIGLVDSIMANPKTLPQRIDRLAGQIESESLLAEILYLLLDAMSLEPDNLKVSSKSVGIKNVAGNFHHLPDALRIPLGRYLSTMNCVDSIKVEATSHLQDPDFVLSNFTKLIEADYNVEEMGPFELYEMEKRDEAIADSILGMLEEVDTQKIATMAYFATQAAEDLRVDLENLTLGKRYPQYPGKRVRYAQETFSVSGNVLYIAKSNLGLIVIGGSGPNTYDGCFGLIVDLGGDDIYNLTSLPGVRLKTIIDLNGRDTYSTSQPFGLAGGFLGTSILMDCEGNDTYEAHMGSLGSAVCGMGLLYDRKGEDTYSADEFSQGAGLLGIGMICDCEGNDTYTAGMQSQAFGYVMGSGLILDRSGNDVYYTKMSQTDILRYDDHYLTLSQGCGFGWRPDYSGGIGLLVDCEGNDLYSSDIFGQGVAYWFAIGALIDKGGHDRYVSYQYAQGSGVHLAFGLLLDDSGNDAYVSKGVSQGCGHDLSVGMLLDLSGNDYYTATDLSQGAGNANATGILYDADGNDSYSAMTTRNVNGYGNYRREFGSIGIQIDERGSDFYGPVGENESIWGSSKYGLGIDMPGKATKPQGDIVVHEYPFDERAFSTQELFILACRGEPRFRRWHSYAFEKMVQDSAATIEFLRGVLDTKDARERHTIKDILRAIGRPALPMLIDALKHGNSRAKAEASWIVGLMGDSDAFDALLDLSESDEWKLRSGALNALGKIKPLSESQRNLLARRLNSVLTDSLEIFYVRKDAAFAAGNQKLCECINGLIQTLNCDHYSARLAAAEAIAKLADCEGISEILVSSLPDLSGAGVAAALHAAKSFETQDRIGFALKVVDVGLERSEMVASALASLVRTIEPETRKEKQEIEKIVASIDPEFWDAQALMGRAQ